MDSLSYELVAQIASYLNAGDALSLSTVCRRVRVACLARLDPEHYLQSTFKNARYLLAAMTDYGCILSGSRALEYFVPNSIDNPSPARDKLGYGSGSASPPSDWDFLVPCFSGSVYGMMDALAKCGVQWQHPLADLFALVGKPVGSSAIIRAATVIHVYPSQLERDSLTPPSAEAMSLYRQLHRYVHKNTNITGRSWMIIEVARSNPSSSTPGANYAFDEILIQDMAYHNLNPHTGRPTGPDENVDPIPLPGGHDGYGGYGYETDSTVIHLINGYITPPGGLRQKVQLFQCHREQKKASTPLEYVVGTYYATHVQCFISGWAAGHFYYDLARQRLSLAWATSPPNKPAQALKACVQKYRRRGYRFFRSNLMDSGSSIYRCDEYDDNLRRVLHDNLNPLFRAALYTPDHATYNTQTSAVHQITREFMGTHIKPSAELQGPQQKQPLAYPKPLSTIRTGRLSEEGYATLRRDGQRVSSGRLGGTGSLLIRFHDLQRGMRAVTRGNIEFVAASLQLWTYYSLLEKSLHQFRFLTLDRPAGIEPIVPDLVRWGAVDLIGQPLDTVPNLCQALANASVDGDLGNRGAPPNAPTTRFDRTHKEWDHYQMLIMMTPTACSGRSCHRHIDGMLPPQI